MSGAVSILFFDPVHRNFEKAASLTCHRPTLLAEIEKCYNLHHQPWRAERSPKQPTSEAITSIDPLSRRSGKAMSGNLADTLS